jgi:hypothetical protein
MDDSWMEDSHVADQNRNQDRNPGSKQADGGDGSSKAKPTDKEAMGGSGGRTGSGIGSPGRSDGMDDATTGSEGGGTSKSGTTGYSAGSRNQDQESDDGEDLSGESGSGKSGSTRR